MFMAVVFIVSRPYNRWRLSDVCMSVAYIGPNSWTERPRKTKIGKGVAHVTRDSDTTFKVKRLKVKVTRSLWLVVLAGRFTHRGLINASCSCSGERGNVFGMENYCYVAVCSAVLGASSPTEGGEVRGPTAFSLWLLLVLVYCLLQINK